MMTIHLPPNYVFLSVDPERYVVLCQKSATPKYEQFRNLEGCRRRVPEGVKQQVRRYGERRRAQGVTWQAIARETALEFCRLLNG